MTPVLNKKVKIDYDLYPELKDDIHGYHDKFGIVCHETISRQIMRSMADVRGVSRFLDQEGYGIQGIVDNDGYKAWMKGHGEATVYHASSFGSKHHGMANTNFMGIECISNVPADYSHRADRIHAWAQMDKEIDALAQLICCAARGHGFPIVDNPGDTTKPGVTTHWEVSMFNGVAGGHVDCWPAHLGGYFPKRIVIAKAQAYFDAGLHF